MRVGSVLASLTRAVLDYGESRGLERARLLHGTGIGEADLGAPEGRLSGEADLAVWRALVSSLDHENGVGLAFASSVPGPRAYGVVALRDMTSDTLGDALRRHCRHHCLIKEHVSALLLESSRGATVVLTHSPGPRDQPMAMAEAALAPYALHARRWTGEAVDPVEVRFEHSAPRDPSAYEALFRCPVHFEQSVTSIRFSREALALPLVGAQREVCDFLEANAEAALSRLHSADLPDLVYRAVALGLDRGDVDVDVVGVARSLGLGVRTLQRRLKDEGLSFQDIADRVRHHRALELLLDPDHPITWIGEHLGFSDSRAFRRAFTRWTGLSPLRYRQIRLGPPRR